MLKQLKDLQHGFCQVVTEQGKTFEGYYNSSLKVIFYTIPSHYKIIGYIQDEMN